MRLITADRHAFFKYMVKSIAEKHGLRATFMPKPFVNLTGNGCHVHVSVWDKGGKTQPVPRCRRASSACRPLAYSFLGGIMQSRRCAVRDLQSDGKQLQAHQRAAHALGRHLVAQRGHLWRQQPHPHDPHSRRRPASSCGCSTAPPIPICCRPRVLAPGSDGMRNKRDPGKRLDINMYTDGHNDPELKRLPLNLLDAIRAFEASAVAQAGFGDDLVASYAKLKHDEWNRYCNTVTDWERETTLDC